MNKIEKILDLGKKIKDTEEVLEALSYDIESKLLAEDADKKVFVNFTVEVPKRKRVLSSQEEDIMRQIKEVTGKTLVMEEEPDVTAHYTESCLVPNDLALKIQMLMFRHYKKYKTDLTKELKAIKV